ncbi:MAG TPA: PAS domain S-box protein [Ktedonobacteraceae bacterium]|nr:PAS domain S-box protein [Ktedonobacteraceae bacterium]
MPDPAHEEAMVSPASAPLHISATGLDQLLALSPDALIVVDEAGIIVAANDQAATCFGYRREELVQMPLESLLPARFRELHVVHRQHYARSPRTRPMGQGLQLVALRKDGTEFPVDISLRPVMLDGALHIIAAIRDVTEQRRAEAERLQRLEQIRLQAELINLAPDAIIVRDSIDRVLFWNRGAEDLYGWTSQQALGHLTHNLLHTRFPTSRAAIDEQIAHFGHWEGELVHTCRDGRSVLVESRQVLFRNEQGQPSAILEINRDITERRAAEQAEQQAHASTEARLAFLQQILDALPSSVYLVYGQEARLLLANQAASSVWGARWPLDQSMLEFLRVNQIAIFDPQGHPLPPERYATLRAVQRGETVLQQQESIRRPDGSSLPVLVNAVVLSVQPPWRRITQEDGQPTRVVLVMHQEVTALKEAEALKDEFVGIAAHELRTPLAALKGFADMLLLQTQRGHGPPLAGWQQEALEEIKQATTRLVTLTEDLLDVTRLQAGRLQLQCTPTDLIALIRRVAGQMQQTTTRHQIEVHTPEQPLVADIDLERMEQVLTNLIGNAIKYSPQGGPISIELLVNTEENMVQVSVKDQGIGIPRHQHAQIFGRFMRADNARTWGIGGTGLGLYLCRELVERHGGRLWFESEEGKGSTFSFTLPLVVGVVSLASADFSDQ